MGEIKGEKICLKYSEQVENVRPLETECLLKFAQRDDVLEISWSDQDFPVSKPVLVFCIE